MTSKVTMYRGIWPFKFIYGKNVNSGSYNWTIQLKKYLIHAHKWIVWTWIDVFSIDELEGSYSPVRGEGYYLI